MNTQPLTPPEPEQHSSAPTPPAPPASEPPVAAPTTPLPEQESAATAPTVDSAATSTQLTKPTPRTSPIVWGSLILVFCAYVFVRTEGWSVDTTTWLITTIIGVGALLLIVGIAVLLRNSRQNR